jgi:alkanesulfonate monooxygenase SsuD/methylene tetrahydromethanopterin reductase-like flavin-dependent oxidoreductase (luciferase family)
MRHGLYLPPVGPLSDPHVLVDMAIAAESSGWDGLFLWDHLQRPPEEPLGLADPWVALTAVASATKRIRIGPLITPVTRRRLLKLAHETATLDQFSRGRLTLGLGLGVNAGGEFSRTGEVLDPKIRGAMLDEGVPLLDKLLRGEHVVHRGKYYTLDGITLSPTGVQRPRVPMWLAARGHALAPVRRAARYEGLALLAITLERFEEIVACVRGERGTLEGFDFAILATPDYPLAEYERRGATWAIHSPFKAKALTTDPETSSVYDMRPDDAIEHVMTVISEAQGWVAG